MQMLSLQLLVETGREGRGALSLPPHLILSHACHGKFCFIIALFSAQLSRGGALCKLLIVFLIMCKVEKVNNAVRACGMLLKKKKKTNGDI